MSCPLKNRLQENETARQRSWFLRVSWHSIYLSNQGITIHNPSRDKKIPAAAGRIYKCISKKYTAAVSLVSQDMSQRKRTSTSEERRRRKCWWSSCSYSRNHRSSLLNTSDSSFQAYKLQESIRLTSLHCFCLFLYDS